MGSLAMSTEELRLKLIPLIRGGYRDDVRCQILLYLKDHPQDEEVWRWYVAASENRAARFRAIEKWLTHNPGSTQAFQMLESIKEGRRSNPPFVDNQPLSLHAANSPFSPREYLLATFVGQKAILEELSNLMVAMRNGINLSLLFVAPSGWGKSYLASLVLDYLDPHKRDRVVHAGGEQSAPLELNGRRFHLVEDVDNLVETESLIPLLDSGGHTFLFTSRGGTNLPTDLTNRLRTFVFSDYDKVELGLIFYDRLFKKGMRIHPEFMLQVANYSHGSPKEAASYGERLSLLWHDREIPDTQGEWMVVLNHTLQHRPDDPDHNYLAIWEEHPAWGMSAEEVLTFLRRQNFPFDLNYQVSAASLQYLSVNQRRVQIERQVITLPPYIFQENINLAGPLAPTLSQSRSHGVILGAHSMEELRAFVQLCGFSLREQSAQENPLTVVAEVHAVVWDRDRGRCVRCGSQENLAFEYVIPLSKGGSRTARNVHILCEECASSRTALGE